LLTSESAFGREHQFRCFPVFKAKENKAMNVDYYTPKEAASKIGVCERTIYRWIHEKKIKAKRWSRRYYIPSEEVKDGGQRL